MEFHNMMKTNRGYQSGFSDNYQEIYNVQRRKQKAQTMAAVLEDFSSVPLAEMDVLDIGASTGIIASELACQFRWAVGVDIDAAAIEYATSHSSMENLSFGVGDATSLPFRSSVFDVVICAQIYEHVPSAEKMMFEIRRVLKPGGLCYFAANNRLMLIEPHHRLPFLSWLPRPLVHLYLRLANRGSYYYELHYTYWALRRLVAGFELNDYTERLVSAPQDFAAGYLIDPKSLSGFLARCVAKYVYWLMPGYVWVLRKTTAR